MEERGSVIADVKQEGRLPLLLSLLFETGMHNKATKEEVRRRMRKST